MRKKISIGGAITLAIMLATVTFIMTMIYAQKAFDSRVYNIRERETMYTKLAEVDQFVRRDYYKQIDDDALSDGIVRGYLSGLGDTNARYMTAAEYKELLGTSEGRSVGIGASFTQDVSGYIRVTEVFPDSPAQVMEIETGDLIVKVDDLAVTAETYEEALAAISGDAGTDVTLVLHHESVERTCTVTRRKVEVPTVDSRTLARDNATGYIRILDFTNATYNEFSAAVTNLINAGVTGIVIDLRDLVAEESDNVTYMLDVADRLVSAETLLSAVYQNGEAAVLKAGNSVELDLPIAVLLNGRSSGAPELLAQILRDCGKGKIIGTVSAGHCSMTEAVPLADGSAVRITTALYQTPVSPNFEGVGVNPDFDVSLPADLAEQNIFALNEQDDPQLRKAVEAAGGSVDRVIVPAMEPDPEEEEEPEEEEPEEEPQQPDSADE